MADRPGRKEPNETSPRSSLTLSNSTALLTRMSSNPSSSLETQKVEDRSSTQKGTRTSKAEHVKKSSGKQESHSQQEDSLSTSSSRSDRSETGSYRDGTSDDEDEDSRASGDLIDFESISNTITAASDGKVKINPPLKDNVWGLASIDDAFSKALNNEDADLPRFENKWPLRHQPSEYTPIPKSTLPKPVTSSNRPTSHDIIRVNSNFIRLNFALSSVLVHISTQDPPSTTLPSTAMVRMRTMVNSGTLFLPLLLFILFEPSSSRVSRWARDSGLHRNSFWIRTWSLILVVLIKIRVVVEVFQHLPRWIGTLLLVIAVVAFVPFFVVVIVMNLLNDCRNAHVNKRSTCVVINVVYGSLMLVHILEMRPSLLNAMVIAATPEWKSSPILNIASLCFNLAIILQLPALFLETSCISFCSCAIGRGGDSAGVASFLLTALFQTSLSSFLTGIGLTMVANGFTTLEFCLYVGSAVIFMILVGCFQLDLLPVRVISSSKQRIE